MKTYLSIFLLMVATLAGAQVTTFPNTVRGSNLWDSSNVKYWGAIGDGATDDTLSISNALFQRAGLMVYIPPGTFLINTNGLMIHSWTTLHGDGPSSVLKMKNSAGSYFAMIFSQHTSYSNVVIRDFTIDQNPVGNSGAVVDYAVSPMFAIYLAEQNLGNVTISGMTFEKATGVQVVNVTQYDLNNLKLTISGNYIHFVRSPWVSDPYIYDNSSFYIEGQQVIVTDNHFFTELTNKAIAAIEVHAGVANVANNVSDGFGALVNVVPTQIGLTPTAIPSFSVIGNTAYRAASGVSIWAPSNSLNGVSVCNNVVYINAQDRETAFGIYQLFQPMGYYGVGLSRGGVPMGAMSDLNISGNTVIFQTVTNAVAPWTAGVYLGSYGHLTNVHVSGNLIVNSPVAGISLDTYLTNWANGVSLNDNTIVNAGSGTGVSSANGSKSGIWMSGKIMNALVQGNHFVKNGQFGNVFTNGWMNITNSTGTNNTIVLNSFDSATTVTAPAITATGGWSMNTFYNGKFGIGTMAPASQLANTATAQNDGAIGVAGLNWVYPDVGYAAGLVNSSVGANANGLMVKSADATSGSLALHVLSGANLSRLAVTGDGKVGIDTATPTAILTVSNTTATLPSFQVFASNNPVPVITVLSNGYVGIGLTNPLTPLHVMGAGGISAESVGGILVEAVDLVVSGVFLFSSGAGTAGQVLTSTDTIGTATWAAPTGGSGGFGPTNANHFGPSLTLSIKDGALLTNLNVKATDGASTALTVNTNVFVVEGGNVGIGTATPGVRLHVVGSSAVIAGITNYANYTGGLPGIEGGAGLYLSGNSGPIGFYVGGGSKAVLAADGSFGIGTLVPSAKLDVPGEGRFGTLIASNATIPIINATTVNANNINLTNALGSNQVRMGLQDLTNVVAVTPANGDVLSWNSTMKKWTNVVNASGFSVSGNSNQIPYLNVAGTGFLFNSHDKSAPGFGFQRSANGNIGAMLIHVDKDEDIGLVQIGPPNPASNISGFVPSLSITNRYAGDGQTTQEMVRVNFVDVDSGSSAESFIQTWRSWVSGTPPASTLVSYAAALRKDGQLMVAHGTFYPSNSLAATMPTAAQLGPGGYWLGNSNASLVSVYSLNGTTTAMKVLAP